MTLNGQRLMGGKIHLLEAKPENVGAHHGEYDGYKINQVQGVHDFRVPGFLHDIGAIPYFLKVVLNPQNSITFPGPWSR